MSKIEIIMKEPTGYWEYVYILQSGRFFKIGFTTRGVNKRIKEMETGNPIPIKIISIFRFNENASIIEKLIQKQFKKKHTQGEWYLLNREDIVSINEKYKSELIKYNLPVFYDERESEFWKNLLIEEKHQRNLNLVDLLATRKISLLQHQQIVILNKILFNEGGLFEGISIEKSTEVLRVISDILVNWDVDEFIQIMLNNTL